MPKKEIKGKVVSNKMDKTIVVQVVERLKHAKYHKFQNHHVKFKAHDPENACLPGDIVSIVECRPLSRDKRWALKLIVERNGVLLQAQA